MSNTTSGFGLYHANATLNANIFSQLSLSFHPSLT